MVTVPDLMFSDKMTGRAGFTGQSMNIPIDGSCFHGAVAGIIGELIGFGNKIGAVFKCLCQGSIGAENFAAGIDVAALTGFCGYIGADC